MYEKLSAILDALREHGITCKAETNAYSGVWEIVCVVPIENGMKMMRVPITHNALYDFPAEYLSAFVLLQATNLALTVVLA